MQTVLLVLISLLWCFGAGWRVYKQARFYQIEEYKSGRYARWLFKEHQRWLPTRPIVAVAVGALFSLTTDTLPEGVALMPYVFAIVSTLVAIMPPNEGETKKAFVRTPRATRLLGGAWGVLGVFFLVASLTIANRVLESDRASALAFQGIGIITFLLAPLWLILGNQVMYPVEAYLRRQFINRAKDVLATIRPKVIGITGSYGKTTTKNILSDILNGRYKAYATPKSYNTMMGVCIAINNDLADDYSVEYFICEMGAYVTGEIQRICELTPPDIGIVIEVGPQHLERFGSLENTAIAKYELIKNVHPEGLGVFNWDNPYTREMYERGYPKHRIAVSTKVDPTSITNAEPRLVASNITETLYGLAFKLTDTLTGQAEAIQTPLVGEHNVMNILLATATALHEGMSLAQIIQRIRLLQPSESRLVRQVNEKGVIVINDAYSANPVSVVSSLKVLGMYPKRRVLITPGMIELGHLHHQENQKLGVLATQYATDIILVGEKQTAPIQEGIHTTSFNKEHLLIMNRVSEAIQWYQTHLEAGDTVLLLNDLPDTY